MKSRKIAAAALLAVGFTIGTVEAREPGIASQTPPGLTLGLPIATAPPQGLYLTARTSAYSADLVDSSGKYYGQTADVYVLSNQLTWVPGWEFLGGKYKAFAVIPFVRTDIDHTAGPPDGPAGALGRFSNFGVAIPRSSRSIWPGLSVVGGTFRPALASMPRSAVTTRTMSSRSAPTFGRSSRASV